MATIRNVQQNEITKKWAFIESSDEDPSYIVILGNREFDTQLDANAFAKDFRIEEDLRTHKKITGERLIAIERRRQIQVLGYTDEEDRGYDNQELACAAAAYALPERLGDASVSTASWYSEREGLWPWELITYKPSPEDRIRELEKAGALIAAQLDHELELARKMPPEKLSKRAKEILSKEL